MLNILCSRRSAVAAVCAALTFFLCLTGINASAASPDVVISQVYGGGGANSGTPSFKNDYVELFNRGASPIDITGWTIQYGSSGGTTWSGKTTLSGTIQAGQYFLIQEAAGGTAAAANLPTPDIATGTIMMSASSGKIALVNNGTTLTGACPSSPNLVDLIGYGSANCSETAPTPILNSNLAALRANGGCSDTDNNSVDFIAATPNPRNSSSPITACTAALPLSATAAASNTSVAAGDPTLLTVRVSPATGPESTGISVTGNLSAIGGSSTQSFYDDGSHGDVTAGDNTFSFAATIGGGTPIGPIVLPISLRDDQLRTASANINLTITPAGTPLAIHEIQGSGIRSAYEGVLVETTGIVTAIKSNGFFIQTPDNEADADPNTSEGVFVFTSSAAPPAAGVGNLVKVRGTVQEFFPASDPASPPATEIVAPVVIALSTANAPPTPITLTSADASPSGGISQLEKFEGMRVHIDTLITTSPTGGSISEANATSTSNGVFYGVFPGTPRPFREPGIETPEATPPGVPSFDANPERIRVDSDGQLGGTRLDVGTGYIVTNLIGVVDYAFRSYTILPDPGNPPVATGSIAVIPAPLPDEHEVTVASFNLERFFDATNDPATSDAVLTATAFANRLNKASLTIRNVAQTPDIVGVEEMENLATLQALADKLNGDAVQAGDPDPEYVAYLEEGNDIGGIDVGFLVKSARIEVVNVTQYGRSTTYINPNSGQPEMLNDRPPLVLHANVKTSGKELPLALTVIVNHLRSLSDLSDPTDGARVRAKRAAQAEYLANLIQDFQKAGENVISVGDYNAYQFSDGYVDVIGTILGTPADQALLPTTPGLVSPPLTDLVNTLDPSERYSYVFDGNGQVLDHVLINSSASKFLSRFVYARNDADFPEVFRNDPNRPERLSDHDIPVAYFAVPQDTAPPVLSLPADITVAADSGAGTVVNFTATAHDAVDGDTSVTCNPPSGTSFAIGGNTVTCSSTDSHENTATGTFTVSVHYMFSGFLPPLSGGGALNAGSVVPVKWQLGFAGGAPVASTAVVEGITAASNADCAGAAEGTPFRAASAGGSTLRYDSTAEQFVFNWKTGSALAGGCYNLTLSLNDGTAHAAILSFK